MEHDGAVASRLAWWWQVRGRLAGQVPLLREAVDRAAPGSDAWCLGPVSRLVPAWSDSMWRAVGDSTPAMTVRQEGEIDPCL
jgi:hypothetical protein